MTDTKREFVDRVLALQNKLAFIIEKCSCTEQRKAIKMLVYLDTLLDCCINAE